MGTTPCDVVRAFVGGMPAGAACHAIKWELTLGTPEDANRWRLTAVYRVPQAGNPGAMIDGPSVTKQGTLTSATVLCGGRAVGRASENEPYVALDRLMLPIVFEHGGDVRGHAA